MDIELKPFQQECSDYLLDYCTRADNKKTLLLRAPTASGKTVMLLSLIERYLEVSSVLTVFIWLSIGRGELEEQSKEKMESLLPYCTAKTLQDVLHEPFQAGDTCFMNWESITKSGNNAISEDERTNLYDRISEGHRNGLRYIVIVDEEHYNNTPKAAQLISQFSPLYTIRVSATPTKNSLYDEYEINESDVIASGLITKALYINEDVESGFVGDETDYLLDLASEKQKEIANTYKEIDENINPLVLIQFPNESPEFIRTVEEWLDLQLGYNYDNGMVAIHMANNSKNFDGITEPNNHVKFLLFKEAISTGWDCPRAKILVKLRENMSEDFEVQTLGRLRRMPHAHHYDNELLDNAYLYTFDEKFINKAFTTGVVYKVKSLFLKDEYKDFKLTKQIENPEYFLSAFDAQEIRLRIKKEFIKEFHLIDSVTANKEILQSNGWDLSNTLNRQALQGRFDKIDDVSERNGNHVNLNIGVSTRTHYSNLRHEMESLSKSSHLSSDKTEKVFRQLFTKQSEYTGKLLSLNTSEFYAFMLNNSDKIRKLIKEAIDFTTNIQNFSVDEEMILEREFKFPERMLFKYKPMNDTPEIIEQSVYKEYTDECWVDGCRSNPEIIFEKFCEDYSDWFYKNGDKGDQYFSTIYVAGNNDIHSFYPDYICSFNNEIWIIETKGGESASGEDQNIDEQVRNKFLSFKNYAESKELHWGFVRPTRHDRLKINNTEYVDDLEDSHWKPIKEELGL